MRQPNHHNQNEEAGPPSELAEIQLPINRMLCIVKRTALTDYQNAQHYISLSLFIPKQFMNDLKERSLSLSLSSCVTTVQMHLHVRGHPLWHTQANSCVGSCSVSESSRARSRCPKGLLKCVA